MIDIEQDLKLALNDLIRTTREKEEYETIYELRKAKMLFSAEVNAFSNQAQREAQVNLLLEEDGSYLKMAKLRTESKIAYYIWNTVMELYRKSPKTTSFH